jgi:adenine-specific DNA-methyltransferase
MVAERRNPELIWMNKDLELHAVGEHGYRWVKPGNPSTIRIPRLAPVATVGTEEASERNVLIVGDSLDGLRAIRAHQEFKDSLEGSIRLVYIDPPFNTGQTFAQFEDSLGHSMWLSMLRDRLAEVKTLLAPSASVWVHLDDTEAHHARCVLDEVFGSEAFVATVVWQKRTTRESRSAFSHNHDYIHVYAPAGPQRWKRSRNLLEKEPSTFQNRDNDPRGAWVDAPFTAPGYRPNQHYQIVNPAGATLLPPKGRSWYATEAVYKRLLEDKRIWFPRGGAGLPRMKLFPHELRGLVPFSLWGPMDGGTNDDAKRHLMSLFPEETPFATPKPEALMERIIHIASDPGDLVVDFFAGSGTTASVAHKMGRRWIAIERAPEVVARFTLPRLRRVVMGKDPGGITEAVRWKGGGGFTVLQVPTDTRGSEVARLADVRPTRTHNHGEQVASDPTNTSPSRRSAPITLDERQESVVGGESS